MTARKPDPFAFLAGTSLLRMGLTPITDQEWVEPFSKAEFDYFYQHKLSVLQQNPQALLVDDAASPALSEFYFALQQHLQRQHGNSVADCNLDFPASDGLSSEDILKAMTLWVPDDICILQNNGDLEYVLTAASVLSPSLWNPADKFQQPLSVIHQPIPNFNQQLMPSVSRFFHHVKAGMPVVRFNWAIQVGDRLDRVPGIEVVQEPLYYRSERQTLLRLPQSQAVVFLIRTRLCELSKLEDMSGEEGTLQRLLEHINNLSQAERDYKGLTALECALERYRK